MSIQEPLMDCVLIINETRSNISLVSQSLPIGIMLINFSLNSEVVSYKPIPTFEYPRFITLAVIPILPFSQAIALVSPWIAVFDVMYALIPKVGNLVVTELKFIILPKLSFLIKGRTDRINLYEPFTLISITFSHNSISDLWQNAL